MQCGETQFYQTIWYQSRKHKSPKSNEKIETCVCYDNINLYLSYLFHCTILYCIGYKYNHKFLFTSLKLDYMFWYLCTYINVDKIFTRPTRPSSPRRQNREIHNPSYSPEKKIVSDKIHLKFGWFFRTMHSLKLDTILVSLISIWGP